MGIALVASIAACASPPDTNACQSIRDVSCDGGYLDDASGAWVTSGWTGPLVPYPANTTIRLCHGLGREPGHVDLWAAFDQGGNLAQQIGSVLEVVPTCNGAAGVTNRSILLRNSGGQDFYGRFVVWP